MGLSLFQNAAEEKYRGLCIVAAVVLRTPAPPWPADRVAANIRT